MKNLKPLALYALGIWAGLSLNAATNAETKVRLILDADECRTGETIWAAVHFELADGWHTYWRYGGEAAQPPQIEWDLPVGVSAGALQWPVPEKYEQAGMFSYVYHDEVMLMLPLSINSPSGNLSIRAHVRWLECQEACVPRNQSLETTLVVGQVSRRSSQAQTIESWRAKVPPVEEGLPVATRWVGEPVEDERSFSVIGEDRLQNRIQDFYPHAYDQFEVTGATKVVGGGAAQRGIEKSVYKYDGPWPTEIAGLMVLKHSDSPGSDYVEPTLQFSEGVAKQGGVNSGVTAVSPDDRAVEFGVGWGRMLLFAFLGGFILNFMPCVLPVIALKILGFVKQSQESPGRVKRLGIVYALGVLASFLVLAGLVIGVQQAGRLASWGMQFQSVGFLVPMMALVTLVALNFFGVFELSLGGGAMGAASRISAREGYPGAFFNGVLTTILATPCTAPFLATALGFAFAQSPSWIVVFFVMIAAGLAFPYVLLSWNPRLLRCLPKPGPWMGRFKMAMGFPMLATAVWLYSVALTHFSNGSELWLGLLLVVIALAAWIWGQFVQQVPERRGGSMGLAMLIGLGGSAWILERELEWRQPSAEKTVAGMAVIEKGIEWRHWSHAAVAKARNEGHPVLVDFTAKWCQNCKVNKRLAIEIDRVKDKLEAIDAVTFRADFTHYDPIIAKELERFHRAGVPLVLVFSSDPSKPAQVLPALLTPQIVIDALDRAVAAIPASG